jgi:hypothetical protein
VSWPPGPSTPFPLNSLETVRRERHNNYSPPLREMDGAIRRCLGPGDFIRINRATHRSIISSDAPEFGEVLGVVNQDELRCRMYSLMTSTILTKFTLQPITALQFPVAARTINSEVVAYNIFKNISREEVEDLVFIVPLRDFESGNVFLTGAANLYYVRYLIDKTNAICFSSVDFFGYHYIQPITVRMFSALNNLSFTVKRLMYHRPESEDTKRSTRIFFPSDAFHYIVYKLRDLSIIKCCTSKKQRMIKYFDDLKSESSSKVVDVTYVRVVTSSALRELRTILGVGIGLGSTQFKPCKTRPLQYCTINSILTSVECQNVLPQNIMRKPLQPIYADGIDFCYSEQNNMLSCHVRFSRLKISSSEVATSRIHTANVLAENVGAYEGAWFQYDGNTFEVQRIENGICYCFSVDEEGVAVELPSELVNQLVSEFGT